MSVQAFGGCCWINSVDGFLDLTGWAGLSELPNGSETFFYHLSYVMDYMGYHQYAPSVS